MLGSIVGALTGGSAAAGAASMLGGLYQNHSAGLQAEWQRDWEKMMSDTAHRREVEDLKAAGLNPLLSVNKGASTPSTGMAPVSDPVTPAINSALAVRANRADVALKEASVENMKIQNEKLQEETAGQVFQNQMTLLTQGKVPEEIQNLIQQRNLSRADEARLRQQIENLLVEEGILRSSAVVRSSDAARARTEQAIDESSGGKMGRVLKRIGEIFRDFK